MCIPYLDPFVSYSLIDQQLASTAFLFASEMTNFTAKRFTLFLLLCVLVVQESHGLSLKEVASVRILNRKVLGSQRAAFGKGLNGNYNHSGKINDKFADWELRGIPAGPDPLHHNGANPKKPRTP
ncbi:protein CLAVATA 3 [Nicotiana tomentosiformis]|uniref:protein CLAVATA 3 n=1 Tax=Nicotiana tomentosiformis TaxID=4098 RepID=UPI00388C4824